ncbi:hypothetical protein JB92DRAFT_2834357 [Gautieria morchelliformis]|nr:hypothetical protein JB92DRAFT_2834357 [Gautieria morchelliformis]
MTIDECVIIGHKTGVMAYLLCHMLVNLPFSFFKTCSSTPLQPPVEVAERGPDCPRRLQAGQYGVSSDCAGGDWDSGLRSVHAGSNPAKDIDAFLGRATSDRMRLGVNIDGEDTGATSGAVEEGITVGENSLGVICARLSEDPPTMMHATWRPIAEAAQIFSGITAVKSGNITHLPQTVLGVDIWTGLGETPLTDSHMTTSQNVHTWAYDVIPTAYLYLCFGTM